jgi:hypothetical protein
MERPCVGDFFNPHRKYKPTFGNIGSKQKADFLYLGLSRESIGSRFLFFSVFMYT